MAPFATSDEAVTEVVRNVQEEVWLSARNGYLEEIVAAQAASGGRPPLLARFPVAWAASARARRPSVAW